MLGSIYNLKVFLIWFALAGNSEKQRRKESFGVFFSFYLCSIFYWDFNTLHPQKKTHFLECIVMSLVSVSCLGTEYRV